MRKNNNHLKRESYYKISEEVFDDYKNLGFNYENNLFDKSMSSLYFLNKRTDRILKEFEKMIFYLIENVKNIKKSRNFAINKNSKKIN